MLKRTIAHVLLRACCLLVVLLSACTTSIGPSHPQNGRTRHEILKSSENLDPTVTSGPFMMKEAQRGNYYTVVRNPTYYQAAQGYPYLDRILFRIVPNQHTILTDLQAGTINSAWFLDVSQTQAYEQLRSLDRNMLGLPTGCATRCTC